MTGIFQREASTTYFLLEKWRKHRPEEVKDSSTIPYVK